MKRPVGRQVFVDLKIMKMMKVLAGLQKSQKSSTPTMGKQS
jgi:hypothetical protein